MSPVSTWRDADSSADDVLIQAHLVAPTTPDTHRAWVAGGRALAASPGGYYEDDAPEELIVLAPPQAAAVEYVGVADSAFRSPARLSEPSTPPPGYHSEAGSAAVESVASPAMHTIRVVPQSTPRVDAGTRAALLQLSSPRTPARSEGGTHSPPPNYPSPPQYITSTPEPFAGAPPGMPLAAEMVDLGAGGWGGLSAEYERQFQESDPMLDESDELAPAYRDDVGFVSGIRRTRHVACFILTVIVYAVVVLYATGLSEWLVDSPRTFQVVIFAAYAVYAIECFGCYTSSLLWGLRTAREANEYFYAMMDALPLVKWHIRCYHLRRPVDPAAARPNDKVVTFNRTVHHTLHGCADVTPIRFFTSHRLCLYEFAKQKRWRDAEAEARHDDEREEFVAENSKDEHHEIEDSWGLEGFEESFLATRPGEDAPWWASWRLFIVFTLLGLSLFYRVYFASRIGKQKITFKKVIW